MKKCPTSSAPLNSEAETAEEIKTDNTYGGLRTSVFFLCAKQVLFLFHLVFFLSLWYNDVNR